MNVFEYIVFIKKNIAAILIIMIIFVAAGAYISSKSKISYTAEATVWTNHPDLLPVLFESQLILEKSVSENGINLEGSDNFSLKVSSKGNIVSLSISHTDVEELAVLMDAVLENSVDKQKTIVSEINSKKEAEIKDGFKEYLNLTKSEIIYSTPVDRVNLDIQGFDFGTEESSVYVINKNIPKGERGRIVSVKYVIFSGLLGLVLSVIGIVFYNYVREEWKKWKKAESS